MQPGCPWSDLANAWLPNIKWCESQLCSIVVEPANTWSNLAYISIGLWLWWRGRARADRLQVTFGRAEVIVGVFSFAFHMSWTGVLQVLDFAAMFVFVGLTLTLNLVRLGWIPPERRARVHWLGVLALTALVVALRFTAFPIQLVTPVLILATVVTEIMIRLRRRARYGWFFASLVTLVGAGVLSALDASRTLCDPDDHLLQGHAMWHVLSAISLAFAWRFYHQLGDGLIDASPARDTASPPGRS